MFEAFEKNKDHETLFKIYYDNLCKVDIEFLKHRVRNLIRTFEPKWKGHLPSIALILEPLYEIKETEVLDGWSIFKSEFNNSKPSQRYEEILKLIGKDFRKRYMSSMVDDEKWLYLDFKKLYKENKDNTKHKLLEIEEGNKDGKLSMGKYQE
jgi:hypothetical protein